jgi:DNA-binding CsgD family transcriptional regulator
MANGFSAPVAPSFDHYQKIAAEYRASIIRCREAIDQLRACEAEFKAIASTCGEGTALAESTSDFRLEHEIALLSQREAQVFGLIGNGLTTQQIAKHLNITGSTVETYRERLKTKLDLESGAALIRHAVLWVSRRSSQSEQIPSVRK